jgi:hypothetical protein
LHKQETIRRSFKGAPDTIEETKTMEKHNVNFEDQAKPSGTTDLPLEKMGTMF